MKIGASPHPFVQNIPNHLSAGKSDKFLDMAKRHVDALTSAILARAFSGKLVPQDPADEPATVLLGKSGAPKRS